MKCLFTAATLSLFFLFTSFPVNGQSPKLGPGFIAAEYADLLWLAFYGISDSLKDQALFKLNSGEYERIFRSAEVGLYNRCEIYLRSDSVVILSLRGTVNKTESWLENFYAGMIPATGSLQLSDGYTFNYKLANRPDAMVHTGWTIGTGFLVKEYLPVLETLLGRGLRNIIITGHSQGGALSFLNTSYIYYALGEKYPGLRLKTYASAAPKPGNLYFAYDFEHLTGNGYAYRVVNTHDWVPESPISVQGLGDFNPVNPLAGAPETIKKQKWPDRVVMKHVYNKMRKGSAKAAGRYQQYLGEGVGKLVKKSLPGYVPPAYSNGSNYMTAGSPIILNPNDAYRQQFPDDPGNVFVHHMYAPYFFLLKSLFPF
jgi:Lipase (class 3)